MGILYTHPAFSHSNPINDPHKNELSLHKTERTEILKRKQKFMLGS